LLGLQRGWPGRLARRRAIHAAIYTLKIGRDLPGQFRLLANSGQPLPDTRYGFIVPPRPMDSDAPRRVAFRFRLLRTKALGPAGNRSALRGSLSCESINQSFLRRWVSSEAVRCCFKPRRVPVVPVMRPAQRSRWLIFALFSIARTAP